MQYAAITADGRAPDQIVAMWGPLAYPAVDTVVGIGTIAEATYRFIHGEILDPKRYQQILNELMDRYDMSSEPCGVTHAMKFGTYKELVNKRFYGKTPIESFVAMEIAVRIANGKRPNVGFRRVLHRTFLGLLALHHVVGSWIDVSNEMIYKYGVSDTNANIASSCDFFTASFYTKTISLHGEFVIDVAPVRAYTTKNFNQPIVGSILFDFIKILFPETSTVPRCDVRWMAHKFFAMQVRAQEIEYHAMLLGKDVKIVDIKHHVTFFSFVDTIMYLGTNMEHVSVAENACIVATDRFMIPFLRDSMNYALRLSKAVI
jgi:hypothetical protein